MWSVRANQTQELKPTLDCEMNQDSDVTYIISED